MRAETEEERWRRIIDSIAKSNGCKSEDVTAEIMTRLGYSLDRMMAERKKDEP